MSRKKAPSGPDLFTAPPSVLSTTRNGEIAIVSGHISGIPDSLAKAVASLRDVERRCESARAVAGILDEWQAAFMKVVAEHAANIIPALEEAQRETHEMHMTGIGLPKVAGEMELL